MMGRRQLEANWRSMAIDSAQRRANIVALRRLRPAYRPGNSLALPENRRQMMRGYLPGIQVTTQTQSRRRRLLLAGSQ